MTPILANTLLQSCPLPPGDYDSMVAWRWVLSMAGEPARWANLKKNVQVGPDPANIWHVSRKSLFWQDHFWCVHQGLWKKGEDSVRDDFAMQPFGLGASEGTMAAGVLHTLDVSLDVPEGPVPPLFIPVVPVTMDWAASFLPALLAASLGHLEPAGRPAAPVRL
jgi:hypothetical protein